MSKEEENKLRRKLVIFVETLGFNKMKHLDEIIKKELPNFAKIEDVESKQSAAESSNIFNQTLSQEAGENLEYHYGKSHGEDY